MEQWESKLSSVHVSKSDMNRWVGLTLDEPLTLLTIGAL